MSIKPCFSNDKKSSIISRYERLIDILSDHELAALGDAYVNFIYSLAVSVRLGKPVGKRVSSSTLSSALKKADLRRFLPPRIDRHKQADAAEALIVYAWLSGIVSLEEALSIIEQEDAAEEAFKILLQTILGRMT